MTTIMNNRLFSLPESILSDIYKMDSTFRYKIRDEIKYDIIKRSWVSFTREFISQPIFKNQPSVVRKFILLIEYLQKIWSSFEIIPSSDIIIRSSWKIMTYSNYNIDYNNDEQDNLLDNEDNEPIQFIVSIKGRRHTEIEGIIYTTEQYHYYDENDDIKTNIDIYQNHEFKIVHPSAWW
jgi:hypothetical protein